MAFPVAVKEFGGTGVLARPLSPLDRTEQSVRLQRDHAHNVAQGGGCSFPRARGGLCIAWMEQAGPTGTEGHDGFDADRDVEIDDHMIPPEY